MPRFLAQNYLAEAQAHRRRQLDRMQIAAPRHIELVEAYPHKGLAGDEGYQFPWKWEAGLEDDDFTGPAELVALVKSDMVNLGSCKDCSLDKFSSLQCSSEASLLSQDIDAAMQGEPSLTQSEELFSSEPLHPWEHNLNTALGVELLEVPLDPCTCDLLLSAVPTALELSTRLKPKLIQDPLLTTSGEQYSHSMLFSADLVFSTACAKCMEESCDRSHEQFIRESLPTEDLDPIMELSVISPHHTPIPPHHGPSQLLLNLSPDATIMNDLQETSTKELQELVKECPAPSLQPLPPPSPPTRAQTSFTSLNNTATGSPDSGIGHALLESPCLPPTHPHIVTPSPLSHITALEPLPLSPEGKLVLLSPSGEHKLLQMLWLQNKTFDSVLALTIPYPDTGCTLRPCSEPVEELLAFLQPLKLAGDLELDLPWDPVADCYDEMVKAEAGLVVGCEGGRGEGVTWVEMFTRDDSTKVDQDALESVPSESSTTSSKTALPCTSTDHTPPPPPQLLLVKSPPSPADILGKRDAGSSDLLPDLSLEFFMMLRAGRSPLAVKEDVTTSRKVNTAPPSECAKGISTPTVCDVNLPAEYRSALDKLEGVASSLHHQLARFGLKQSSPEAVQFFLRQQQKLLADTGSCDKDLLFSCKLAASLVTAQAVGDALTHGSLVSATRTYGQMMASHAPLLKEGGAAEVRGVLLELQVASGVRVHPKLQELARVVARWLRGDAEGKAVVVLERQLPGLATEALEVLQSLPGTRVAAVTTPGALNRALQDCNCVLLSAALVSSLPWSQISLLVVYQHPGSSVFPDGSLPDGARLSGYVSLQTAAATNFSLAVHDFSDQQFTFVVSEVVLGNAELLRLLENRYNISVIERDYPSLAVARHQELNYADVIVSGGCGILLRPLSLLSADPGWQAIVGTATSLYFQYNTTWIVLYNHDKKCYPFGGCVPTNLARLHASVAHFSATPPSSSSSSLQPYQVSVCLAPSLPEAAAIVRRIAEHTLGSSQKYLDYGEWLHSDVSKAEQVLLQFPCLNSFSAQLMLRHHSLVELFNMQPGSLDPALSCLPEKVISLFYQMCCAAPTGGCYGNEMPDISTEETIIISDDNDEPNVYYHSDHPEEYSSNQPQVWAPSLPPAQQQHPAALSEREDTFAICLPPGAQEEQEEEEGKNFSFFTALPEEDERSLLPAEPWGSRAPSQQWSHIRHHSSLAPREMWRERGGCGSSTALPLYQRLRTPVRVLDLGLEGNTAMLCASDSSSGADLSYQHSTIEAALPQPLVNAPGSGKLYSGRGETTEPQQGRTLPERRSFKMSSLSELSAFHSRQREGDREHHSLIRGLGQPPAPTKRHCPARNRGDSLVPSDPLSSPTVDERSLYGPSPPALLGLTELSPLRRRKLVCERVAGNEQTRLTFRREL